MFIIWSDGCDGGVRGEHGNSGDCDACGIKGMVWEFYIGWLVFLFTHYLICITYGLRSG